jgi:hypothetical protein
MLLSSDNGKIWKYSETVQQLFRDIKKACDSVRREVSYNSFIEFAAPMKLVGLNKMCLKVTYIKVCIGIHFSTLFFMIRKQVYNSDQGTDANSQQGSSAADVASEHSPRLLS